MNARCWWVGALLVALAGCETYTIEGNYTCTDPDKGHRGPDGMPDPCHYQDAGAPVDAGASCAVGELEHYALHWASPTLLWFGPEGQAPECPQGPKTMSYEGHTDLVAPTACEACTCEPSTGSCALPSKLTASPSVCDPQVMPTIPWDAPTPWDGQCDSTNPVAAGLAHSLTIGPLTKTENGCAIGPSLPAKVIALHWDTYARTCDIGLPDGPNDRSICLPADLVPPGFRLCVFHDGDLACPSKATNDFTEQHVFYGGVEDNRQCSACSCGAPAGSACTATISIYKNANCSAPLNQITVSSSSETCTDIQFPGQALGSKKAGPTTYLPGVCPAMGGDASGGVIKTDPITICCLP
jgi:hypothetical protein